jgi:hypothetical protein
MSLSTPRTAGGGIRTHPLPPNGFNPRTASPLELRRYGLPQRPDPAIRPELAARWDEIFSRKRSGCWQDCVSRLTLSLIFCVPPRGFSTW